VAAPAVQARGAAPLLFFSNPNIHPLAEYDRRLVALQVYAQASGLEVLVDDAVAWPDWIAATAACSGGDDQSRCAACLRLRLDRAAARAVELGMARFATSLGVSPYQRHDLIRSAGAAAATAHDVEFVYMDLRDAFSRSYAESRRLGLYRQQYCGCAVSMWEAWQARRSRRRAG
jgi:predicted adenine nucleotide alpha hydrolase (AANH) superfamily ATPase